MRNPSLAVRVQPERWTPPPAIAMAVQQRLTHRAARITRHTHVRTQVHALLHQPTMVASVHTQVEPGRHQRTRQIAEIERERVATRAHDAAWAAAAARLQPITGSGSLTAVTILTTTRTVMVCRTAEAATAYAGRAPNPYPSGSRVRGRRRIGHPGNRQVRRVLDLASLRAARSNPVITPLYER